MLGRMLRIDRRGLARVSSFTPRRLLLSHSLLHQQPPIRIPPAAAIDGRCYSGTSARCARRHRAAAGDGDDDFTIIDVDFGRPHEWYPAARRFKRSIVCHVGPTNSGKTYEALERLRGAQNGVYCGPLRLLAWEVHEKLNAAGVPCNLRTGQELTEEEGARHTSCTVEMVNVNREYDVAVVDECQLIGDSERGHAWTRAILGLPAVELHLCGSPAFLPLVQRLARHTGDTVEIRRYERLSPLTTAKRPVKDWGADIKPGDCVVAFSRRKLFQLKNEIEVATAQRPTAQRLRCCVVYGALPPEARREQARLFNDETSGFDVLVASDAVGLGLNLNIARIILTTTEKFDGAVDRRLDSSEIKQIAGRAGRFQSRFEEGIVSARTRSDLALIAHALKSPDPPVEAAGVAPTHEQLQLFARANGLRLRETEKDYRLALESRRRVQQQLQQRGGQAQGRMSLAAVAPDGHTYIEFARLLQFFQRAAKLGGGDRDGVGGVDGDGEEEEDAGGSSLYFLVEMDDMVDIARLIEEVPMSLEDRFTFCLAPVDAAKRELMAMLRFYALQFYRDGRVRLEIDILSEKVPATAQQLAHLEEVHAITDCYLWLGQRFGDDIFVEMAEAARAAELCSELIDQGLQVMRPKGLQGSTGGEKGVGGGGGSERGRFPRGRRQQAGERSRWR